MKLSQVDREAHIRELNRLGNNICDLHSAFQQSLSTGEPRAAGPVDKAEAVIAVVRASVLLPLDRGASVRDDRPSAAAAAHHISRAVRSCTASRHSKKGRCILTGCEMASPKLQCARGFVSPLPLASLCATGGVCWT